MDSAYSSGRLLLVLSPTGCLREWSAFFVPLRIMIFFLRHWRGFGSALAKMTYVLYWPSLPVLLTLVTTKELPHNSFLTLVTTKELSHNSFQSPFNFCFIYFESMLLNSSKLSFVMSFWIDPSIEKCFSLPLAMFPAWKSTFRAIPVLFGWMLV